jgi:hypothetical protein
VESFPGVFAVNHVAQPAVPKSKIIHNLLVNLSGPGQRLAMLERATLALSAAQTVVNASQNRSDRVRRSELLAFVALNVKRTSTARSDRGAQLASASAVACAQLMLEDCGLSLSLQPLAA